MRKIRLFCFICLFFIILCTPVEATAADLHEQVQTDSIWKALPAETRKLLSASGFSPSDMESASIPKLISVLSDSVSAELYAPLRTGVLLIALLLFGRILLEFSPDALLGIVQFGTTLSAGTLLVRPILRLIEQTEALIGTLSALLTASIPVYTGILVMSGSAITGSTYGALTLAGGGGIAALSLQLFLPLTRVFLALSIAAALTDIGLKKVTETLYHSVKWVLILAVTVFTGILSLQTLLSAQSDAVTVKAAKMVAAGAVPIVGGAFSDAFSVLGTSIGMVKSGTGSFGLLASLVVFLPVCLQSAAWILSGSAVAFAAELFEMDNLANLITGCVSAIKMLVAILCSTGFVSLVAAAVLLCVRGAYG